MKKTYPIKTDLFRFVTVRTPNHLTQQAKVLNFIYHPNLSKSKITFCPILSDKKGGDERIFQDFLKSFQSLKDYNAVRRINPELYDYSSMLFRERDKFLKHGKEINSKLLLTEEQLILIFDQLYYQIITKESKYVRQACVQMIITNHILKFLVDNEQFDLKKVFNVKIVISKEVIQCFKPWLFGRCGADLSGVNRLGIADFRKVEQEVCCYVPGEVSHIENILASEYKERQTRNLVRTELTVELTKDLEIENLTDVTTSTRNEISTEVSSVLNQDRSSNYGGSLGVSGNYLGAEISADTYADFANANSSTHSDSSAKTYAEEVTRRALEKIVQRTTEKRTSKITKEFEENIKHGFDNRKGSEHVTGIYRWIDILYTNRLVNYGKRLMFEFLIPEPATFYKRAINYKPEPVSTEETIPTTEGQKPKSLPENGVKSPADINRNNYTNLASLYGVTILPPREEQKTISQAFTPTPPIKHNGTPWTQSFNVPVEQDYEAHSVSGRLSFDYRAYGLAPDAYFKLDAGGVLWEKTGLRSKSKTNLSFSDLDENFPTKHTNQVPIVFKGVQLFTYSANSIIVIKLKSSVFSEWQTSAYNQLEKAYKNQLSQYETEQNQKEKEGEVVNNSENNTTTNSAFNRIIEQRELKRICIEMITKPFCREEGKKFYTDLKPNQCDKDLLIPQISQNKDFEAYASQVKFFEQAFDWRIMSYLFYPYYWADKCDWVDLFQSEDEDLIFQAFKQAGMARVVVPVRPEFNEAVMFYLETGDIWLGGDLVVETDDDLYLSIAEEMQNVGGIVEEEWETRVPTSLAIVQKDSALLNESGLPCCHDDVESAKTPTNIESSKNFLKILNPE